MARGKLLDGKEHEYTREQKKLIKKRLSYAIGFNPDDIHIFIQNARFIIGLMLTSRDIDTSKACNQLIENKKYIDLYNKASNSILIHQIQAHALVRLISPDYFNGFDITNSKIYKDGIQESWINRENVVLAASLKTLAAKSIRVDYEGIQLEMPKGALSSQVQMPEIVRFEV